MKLSLQPVRNTRAKAGAGAGKRGRGRVGARRIRQRASRTAAPELLRHEAYPGSSTQRTPRAPSIWPSWRVGGLAGMELAGGPHQYGRPAWQAGRLARVGRATSCVERLRTIDSVSISSDSLRSLPAMLKESSFLPCAYLGARVDSHKSAASS